MRNRLAVVVMVGLVILAAVPAVATESGHGGWVLEKIVQLHNHLMGQFHHRAASHPSYAAPAGSSSARRAPQPDVAGKWAVEVTHAGGSLAVTLVLRQDGTKLAGTCSSPHGGDAVVTGEIADGSIHLSGVFDANPDAAPTVFTGKLTDTGTLEGTVTGPLGDMTWTATRVKDR